MSRTRDYLAAGIDETESTTKLAIRVQALPRFSREELAKLAPHVIRALATLHTGDYPEPYIPDYKLINIIIYCQDQV